MANDLRIDIRSNLRAVAALFELSAKRSLAAATAQALNRTLTTVRAEAAREMKKHYGGLKIAAIKRQMKFTRATSTFKAAALVFSGKRFRLFGNWPVTKTVTRAGVRLRLRGVTRTGVNVKQLPFQIETWRGDVLTRAELRHAFIQRSTRNGAVNVFLRVGRARYPIEGLVVPGLARAFVEKHIDAGLARLAHKRFPIEFERALQYYKHRTSIDIDRKVSALRSRG